MTPALAIFTYLNAWFVGVMFVIPFGRKHGVRWILKVNTLLAAIVLVVVYAIVSYPYSSA